MLFGFDSPEDADSRAREDQATEHDLAADHGSPSRRFWLYGLVGIVLGSALTLMAATLFSTDDPLGQDDVDEAIATALAEAAPTTLTAGEVFNQVAPSLVVVRGLSDDPDVSPSIGAGIVINERGQVLTANHVIASADSFELGFSDGSVVQGRLESTNTDLDMALLDPVGSGGVRVPAVLGNARTLQIGDPIYAVGNPLGLTGSITSGVISGLNRDVPMPDVSTEGDSTSGEAEFFENLIQFDAAVNQGSSGGPLLNAQGQVIGIVTALADPTGEGFFVGIGFAVPIDIAAGGAANGPTQ